MEQIRLFSVMDVSLTTGLSEEEVKTWCDTRKITYQNGLFPGAALMLLAEASEGGLKPGGNAIQVEKLLDIMREFQKTSGSMFWVVSLE